MPSISTMGDGRDERLSFEYILRYWHVQRFCAPLLVNTAAIPVNVPVVCFLCSSHLTSSLAERKAGTPRSPSRPQRRINNIPPAGIIYAVEHLATRRDSRRLIGLSWRPCLHSQGWKGSLSPFASSTRLPTLSGRPTSTPSSHTSMQRQSS